MRDECAIVLGVCAGRLQLRVQGCEWRAAGTPHETPFTKQRGAPSSRWTPPVFESVQKLDHGVNVIPRPLVRFARVPHGAAESRCQPWKYQVLPGRISPPEPATGVLRTMMPLAVVV